MVITPDHRIQCGYVFPSWSLPSWRTVVYDEPFEQPRWGAYFGFTPPIEVVTCFTSALARLHLDEAPLFEELGTGDPGDAFDGFTKSGWTWVPGILKNSFQYQGHNGDNASAWYSRLDSYRPDPFQTGQDGRWNIDGRKDGRTWTMSIGQDAPRPVITALVDAVVQLFGARGDCPVGCCCKSDSGLSGAQTVQDMTPQQP